VLSGGWAKFPPRVELGAQMARRAPQPTGRDGSPTVAALFLMSAFWTDFNAMIQSRLS